MGGYPKSKEILRMLSSQWRFVEGYPESGVICVSIPSQRCYLKSEEICGRISRVRGKLWEVIHSVEICGNVSIQWRFMGS